MNFKIGNPPLESGLDHLIEIVVVVEDTNTTPEILEGTVPAFTVKDELAALSPITLTALTVTR